MIIYNDAGLFSVCSLGEAKREPGMKSMYIDLPGFSRRFIRDIDRDKIIIHHIRIN